MTVIYRVAPLSDCFGRSLRTILVVQSGWEGRNHHAIVSTMRLLGVSVRLVVSPYVVSLYVAIYLLKTQHYSWGWGVWEFQKGPKGSRDKVQAGTFRSIVAPQAFHHPTHCRRTVVGAPSQHLHIGALTKRP